MVDVRGDVLRPPHGTTPAAVTNPTNYLHINRVVVNYRHLAPKTTRPKTTRPTFNPP